MTFFDDSTVFEAFRQGRPGVSNPVYVMEEPALFEALGATRGLRVVDLGCGEATLGQALLAAGCDRYLGIDDSARMVDAAREALRGTAGEVERAAIEDFAAPAGSFDLVVSRLALHYVADLAPVLAACRDCLSPAGRVVFTVMHPVITSHDARASTDELRTSWIVDDYFDAGPREQRWLGGRTVWHHRTVEDYVAALTGAGFALTALGECRTPAERFDGDEVELARRRRIPLFLLLAGALSV